MLNRNDYRAMEKELSNAINSGQKVSVKIEVSYSNNGVRPSSFMVTPIINGVTEKPKIFGQ